MRNSSYGNVTMSHRELSLFFIVCCSIFCNSFSLSSLTERRYIAEVCYDGSDFTGWQSQSTKRSAQGVLNQVLSSAYNTPVKVCGASRTDKGVHAQGQIIHFDLPSSFVDKDTIYAINDLNRKLPDDLKLARLSHAPEGLLEIQRSEGLLFHAIENAISKKYSYDFSASKFAIDPMTTRYRASLYNYKAFQQFDIIAFQDALNIFIGRHDFRAFGNKLDIRAKRSEEYSGHLFSSVRTIESATISEIQLPQYPQYELNNFPSDSNLTETQSSISSSVFAKSSDNFFYRVDIVLDGALYKMLRNIIAGCVEVAYGTMSLQELRMLLDDAVSRTDNRLVTAPACGLCLQRVNYIEKMFLDES